MARINSFDLYEEVRKDDLVDLLAEEETTITKENLNRILKGIKVSAICFDDNLLFLTALRINQDGDILAIFGGGNAGIDLEYHVVFMYDKVHNLYTLKFTEV